ncbi:MAG TPA: GNAT family N-acetyltransferase [Acidimicrobiia bacterium]|nr:GNAT family N-acetyltransferase [Acidimicrobiia bacterium]
MAGRGFATEAATAMIEWLAAGGTRRLVAHIQPDHAAPGKVAAALGLVPTGEVDFDVEMIWER